MGWVVRTALDRSAGRGEFEARIEAATDAERAIELEHDRLHDAEAKPAHLREE